MSNLTKRVLAGVIGIPLILGACYSGGIYFLIFSIIVSSLALGEFYIMFEKKGFSPLKYFAIIISAALMVAVFRGDISIMFLLPFVFAVILTVEIFRKDKNPLNVMILIFGILYITIPFIILNIFLDSTVFKIRINIVIYTFILIWVCDTAAYFGGRIFGKHQLSVISPKKTWEGSAAGFIFTIIISLLIHFIFPDKLSLTDAVVFGFIVGIFSQTGDLFESLIKRYCDVKDSSNIIPGHGGILDRFDSLIFVTPFILFYLMIFKYS